MTHSENPLQGKIIMVTGATAGIGKVTAMELARMGAGILLVSRNPEKCAATADRIRNETGNPQVDYLVADLSSQAQIRHLVKQFKAGYNRLDVLVNNAGAFFISRRLSVDGIEMTLALNHLSYFLLTNLLLDVLEASAPARVVNVSSNAHFDAAVDLNDLQLENGYSPFKAYGRSKFANVSFTYELARRTQNSGVVANVLHPGLVQTDIGKNASWWMGLGWIVFTLFRKGLTPEQGAQTSIYLASSPEVEHLTGKYFAKQKVIPSDPATYDMASAQRLWDISARMVGLQEG
jgi:NAD(P)-dependent dehydrogenase (short-subunit alcohol dehydrogenase family)